MIRKRRPEDNLTALTRLLARDGYRRSSTPFALSSGGISNVLIDASHVLRTGEGFGLLCQLIKAFVPDNARSVGGPACGAESIIFAALTARPDLTGFIVRKTPKGRGLDEGWVSGIVTPPVFLVEDVVTTGGSLLRAARAVGLDKINGALTVVLRDPAIGSKLNVELGNFTGLISLSDIEAAIATTEPSI